MCPAIGLHSSPFGCQDCREAGEGDMIAPHQLGYGVSGEAEAAVHAVRQYIGNLRPQNAVVKISLMLVWDVMLDVVEGMAPDMYPFVHSV